MCQCMRIDHKVQWAYSFLLCIHGGLKYSREHGHQKKKVGRGGMRGHSLDPTLISDSLYLPVQVLVITIRKSDTMRPGVSRWRVYMSSASLYFGVHSFREKSSSHHS